MRLKRGPCFQWHMRLNRHNSAAVILAHNHPFGIAEPSRADELLTQSLKQSLDHIDYRILDRTTVVQISVMP